MVLSHVKWWNTSDQQRGWHARLPWELLRWQEEKEGWGKKKRTGEESLLRALTGMFPGLLYLITKRSRQERPESESCSDSTWMLFGLMDWGLAHQQSTQGACCFVVCSPSSFSPCIFFFLTSSSSCFNLPVHLFLYTLLLFNHLLLGQPSVYYNTSVQLCVERVYWAMRYIYLMQAPIFTVIKYHSNTVSKM